MSYEELELLRMVREHPAPEKALLVAVEVIRNYLAQPGSSAEPAAAYPQESAGISQ